MIIYSTNAEKNVIRARRIKEDSQVNVMKFIKSGKVWENNGQVWNVDEENFKNYIATSNNNETYMVITSSSISATKISNEEDIINLAKRLIAKLNEEELILIGQSADCFDIPKISFNSGCYYCGEDPVYQYMRSE